MQKFDLSLWLKDKSRRVITRNNIEVEIIHDSFPLVAIINGVAYNFDHDGKFQSNKTNHKYDLFFADEKELTEFEKEVDAIIDENIRRNIGVKYKAKNLLDLARKEIEKECRIVDKDNSDWEEGYEQGKQDALKDLPKWEHNIMFPKGFSDIAAQGFIDCVYSDGYLRHGKYQIKMSDLEKLPKEE